MRSSPDRRERPAELIRRIEGLSGLPLRPLTARAILNTPADESDTQAAPRWAELDPGYSLNQLTSRTTPVELVAARPWWPKAAEESLERLWRHSVAVSCAARRLAAEAGRPDPERWARIGLLHNLGLWALAAVAPEGLESWFALGNAAARREAERAWLGKEASSLGRDLAERWGADPALVDATWLIQDRRGDLGECTGDPEGMALVRRALSWAERTPWSIGEAPADAGAADPRLRLLVAEVQIRCGADFIECDATPHEERLARAHAALLLRSTTLERGMAARDRLLQVLADADPSDSLPTLADRAALAWCSEPEVTAATASWDPSGARETRPHETVLSLGRRRMPSLSILAAGDPASPRDLPAEHPALAAWHGWADLVADRDRLARRLDATTRALRLRVEREEAELRRSKLDALAEFAAGAGHELNNPLAVIQGRAQLLMHRQDDPEVLRSLRIIVAQVQRAHRMLRDLLYVARPPQPRPRPCQLGELFRAVIGDLNAEAESRGVRLTLDVGELPPWAWADPEPIRHAAEVLARNALEATPRGGVVRVCVSHGDRGIELAVSDGGRGIDARSGMHLFDPFYCGREAGRGLGLGLPRAGRALALAGGDLSWRSSPGRGTSFHATVPLATTPEPVA